MSRLKMVMPFVVNIIPNGDLQLAMQLVKLLTACLSVYGLKSVDFT